MIVGRINRTNNTVGRINSRRVSAGAGGWWLAGGIEAAKCWFAYQGKSASDKASSLVNLANPGTNNLTEIGTVGWSTAGWSGFNSSNYFQVSNTPDLSGANANTQSAFMYIDTNGSYSNGCVGSLYRPFTSYFVNSYNVRIYWWQTQYKYTGGLSAPYTICFAGNDIYINGVYAATVDDPPWLTNDGNITIGTPLNDSSPDYYAMSYYDVKLTSDQAAALHAAVVAL